MNYSRKCEQKNWEVRDVQKALLKLNHEIHEQEVKAGLHTKGKTKKKQKADASGQMKLF
jgi:hypothetical protein